MERANQWIQVATSWKVIRLPWDSREALLAEIRPLESTRPIVYAFEAVGTSRPVRLSPEQAVELRGLLTRWCDRVTVDELPAGVWDLRNALAEDTHDAELVP